MSMDTSHPPKPQTDNGRIPPDTRYCSSKRNGSRETHHKRSMQLTIESPPGTRHLVTMQSGRVNIPNRERQR